jgi:dTDP-4-dehydrorhamnose reductase
VYRVNAEAPKVKTRWAALRRVPIVHFSTDYVFDGSGERPWREDDPTGPLSVYGASKLAGEAAIRSAGGSHLIIRASWVFAAHGRNFLNTIARLARDQNSLRIVADQFGAPTPARSIAEGVVEILSGISGLEDDARTASPCAEI